MNICEIGSLIIKQDWVSGLFTLFVPSEMEHCPFYSSHTKNADVLQIMLSVRNRLIYITNGGNRGKPRKTGGEREERERGERKTNAAHIHLILTSSFTDIGHIQIRSRFFRLLFVGFLPFYRLLSRRKPSRGVVVAVGFNFFIFFIRRHLH